MNPKARSGCTVGLPSPGLTRSFTGEGLIYPAHRVGQILARSRHEVGEARTTGESPRSRTSAGTLA